jgi:ABC-2 type transport system ATP-binding protein
MSILEIHNLTKTYDSGTKALKDVSLSIEEGEIFALLGPNGAGKTTLIGIITGLVNKTSGKITIQGIDADVNWRKARQIVSLVPQEINVDIFLTVYKTLEYQRGFYGKPQNPELYERVLKALSLWDKKDAKVQELSGGMKRRVLIAKALMNEPRILFLDEPTAGVDVELRKGMWDYVWELKRQGVTIILTTHYLEEAEMMADRVGVINGGELLLVEDKDELMKRMGSKTLEFLVDTTHTTLPASLNTYELLFDKDKKTITYTYKGGEPKLARLIAAMKAENIQVTDVDTKNTSLEEIFLELVGETPH